MQPATLLLLHACLSTATIFRELYWTVSLVLLSLLAEE